MAHVEFREDSKFRLIPQLCVFFDESVEQFGTIIKRRKKLFLQEGVLKTGQTVLFSLHFFEVIAIDLGPNPHSLAQGVGRSPLLSAGFFVFPPVCG